jgi:hypothetical protein
MVSGTWPSQRHVELLGQRRAAALAEDLVPAAGVVDVARHVLDHPDYLVVELERHPRRAPGHLLGGELRRGDHHEAGLREELGQRHRHVPGAWGQVDDQVVQLAPVDVGEELVDRLVQHGPAPDDGGVLLDKEADRHDLDRAVGQRRHDGALAGDHRALVDAEHAWDRIAPNVGIEDPDVLALLPQGGGQVGTQRRLADTALARGHAEDRPDLGQRALGQRRPAEPLLQLALLGLGEHVEFHLHVGDALQGDERLGDGLLEVRADRAAGGRQRDDDHRLPVGGDVDAAHHAEVDDRAAQLGIHHRRQRL